MKKEKQKERQEKKVENKKSQEKTTEPQQSNIKSQDKPVQAIMPYSIVKIDLLNDQIAKAVSDVYGLINPRNNDPSVSSILQYERRPSYGKEVSIIGKDEKSKKNLRLTFSYETGELIDFKFGKQNASELSPEFVEDIKTKAAAITKLIKIHDIQAGLAISQSSLQQLSEIIQNTSNIDLDRSCMHIFKGKELYETGTFGDEFFDDFFNDEV